MIYMFLSNNPSSGDINSSNLPCDIQLWDVISHHFVMSPLKTVHFLIFFGTKNTVKPVLSGHLKRTPKSVFKTNKCLMQVKSIAECSKC